MYEEGKERDMPPLATPASAVVFMVVFFVVMIGIPLLFVGHGHHMHK